MENRYQNKVPEFTSTYSIIDGTELPVESYVDDGYSGKKKGFTLKYQILVGLLTGSIIHIYGPELGSLHDSTMLRNSKLDKWLFMNDEYALGDGGYEGCLNIISKIQKPDWLLSHQEKLFNKNIGKYRHTVERVLGNLKKWHILKKTALEEEI